MLLTKLCKSCNLKKTLDLFNNDKHCKLGVKPSCKDCVAKYKKIYRENNKEQIRLKRLEYEGSDEVKQKRKEYRDNNKTQRKEARDRYVINNIDTIKAKRRIYQQNNRNKINLYMKNRFDNDPQAKLAHNLRARFHDALKRGKLNKTNNTKDIIGCSFEQVKVHLESQFTDGMDWTNHGRWHIDHIIPVASFDLSCDEDRRKCFHYTNLQPLWAEDNLKKGSKLVT